MSGERLNVWKDPNVLAAMKAGRHLDDIAVLSCPRCGQFSYYNQGSWFTCRHCECSWYIIGEDEEPPLDASYMRVDWCTTMQDVLDAECSDYP